MQKPVTCIYCGDTFDSAGSEGDHIIPSALGEFKGDVRFRRICRSCNSKIGESEQQIMQSGPEAIFREYINPKSKRKRYRKSGMPRGAKGAPAPEHIATVGGQDRLVQPVRGKPGTISPVDHILVNEETEYPVRIRLFSGMTAQSLIKLLEKHDITKVKTIRLFSSDELSTEFRSLIKSVIPNSKFEAFETLSAGTHANIPCKINIRVNSHYTQGIAKIAFHYYLVHARRGFTGAEPEFDAVRRFILTGVGYGPIFRHGLSERFVICEGRTLDGQIFTNYRWMHILAASEENQQAIVRVQLFRGTGCDPPPHYVLLGRWTNKIVSASPRWAHKYEYCEMPESSRHAGYMCPVLG